MSAARQPADVSCYAGYRADQEPRSFRVAGAHHEVAEVVQRWREPDVDGFAVRTTAGQLYELRHERDRDIWTAAPRSPAQRD